MNKHPEIYFIFSLVMLIGCKHEEEHPGCRTSYFDDTSICSLKNCTAIRYCNDMGCSECVKNDDADSDICTYTDSRNGTVYPVYKIDCRFWLGKNLDYRTGTYYFPDGNSDNAAEYGLLYDWDTANKVCPQGWHLPTKDEFTCLTFFARSASTLKKKRPAPNGILLSTPAVITQKLEPIPNDSESSERLMAESVICEINEHSLNWKSYCEDPHGFGALNAGSYEGDSGYSDFGKKASFWSSTIWEGYEGAYNLELSTSYHGYGDTLQCKTYKDFAYSVRCVKD